jgi:hypothetical protein
MSQGAAKGTFANPGWQDWTPTYANLTIGDGTVTARYIQVGTQVTARWHFILGSTSAVATNPEVILPVAVNTDYVTNMNWAGGVQLLDTGTARHQFYASIVTATDAVIFYDETGNGISATLPFTWTTGDSFSFTITYEAAAAAFIGIGKNNDHGSMSGLTDWDHSVAAGAWRRDTSNQVISNASNTNVIYNTELFENDDNNNFSFSTASGVCTINAAGIYVVTVGVDWQGNATGRRICQALLNAGSIGACEKLPGAATTISQNVAAVFQAVATDTVSCRVWQNSGGNLNANDDAATTFTIARLG